MSTFEENDDDDDDSDVMVVDPPANWMRRETIGTDCDPPSRTQHDDRKQKKRKRRGGGTMAKGSIAAKSAIGTAPCGEMRGKYRAALKKRIKTKPEPYYYDNVFEGCNSLEPIEIDDEDGDDDDDDDDDRNDKYRKSANDSTATTAASTVENVNQISDASVGIAKDTTLSHPTFEVIDLMDDEDEDNDDDDDESKAETGTKLTASISGDGLQKLPRQHPPHFESNIALDKSFAPSNQSIETHGKRSVRVDSFRLSNENPTPNIARETVRPFRGGGSKFHGREKASVSQHAKKKNSRANQNEKSQPQRKPSRAKKATNGMSLKTISPAVKVTKARRIRETKNAALLSEETKVEAKLTSTPTLVGNDGKERNHEAFGERISECSWHSKPQCRQARTVDLEKIHPIELEVQNDTKSKLEEDDAFQSKGTTAKTTAKPRFKPNKNMRVRKGQKVSNAVTEKRTESSVTGLPKSTDPDCTNRNGFAQNDGENSNRGRPNSHSKRNLSSGPENRFIFHPSNDAPREHHSDRFLGMNLEDARKEQERLLQKAAARVRSQPVFHVSNEPSSISRNNTVVHPIAFSTLVRNVHLQHPDHFKYRNFYSRLGLPRHANESLVKSQYRRLARVYHPDRNIGKPDTRHKFQAVTEAYNSIMNE